jgi:cytochrome bd-type quinol oxidase subunit 2
MRKRRTSKSMGILATVAYALMVFVNVMANALPINGMNTGQVSDSFPNLFAPAAITFSIWGVIYLLLAIYLFFQFADSREMESNNNRILNRINLLFIVSSIANAAWIFAWHYLYIGVSVLIMLVMFFSLLAIVLTINNLSLNKKEKFWISVPFSVYFGWINVALIANITGFLVKSGWKGFGLPEYIWTIAILIVGLIIGGTTIWRLKDKAYGLVFVWAYLGILIKHLSSDGFAGAYPGIIATSGISIGIFVSIIFLTYKKKRRKIF